MRFPNQTVCSTEAKKPNTVAVTSIEVKSSIILKAKFLPGTRRREAKAATAPAERAASFISPSQPRRPGNATAHRKVGSAPLRPSPENMGVLELFITACVPVLNLLLVAGIGSFLATDFAGILSKEARKHLNKIVFYVFNPSLVAIYLAKTITMESLANLWFMPVNVLLAFTFGLLFGWIVIHVTRPPTKLRGLILGCCSAGNLGNMFLVIIPAICKEKGSPFGAADVCQTNGLAYSSLSKAIGGVFVWLIVYNIVRVTSNVTEGDGDAQTNQTKVLTSGVATGIASEGSCSISNHGISESTLPLIPTNIPHTKYKVPFSERAMKCLSSVSATVDLKKIFAPSTIALIVGFIIGGTPLIRNAIIGDSAPLRVLQESAELIGPFLVKEKPFFLSVRGIRGGANVPPSVIAGVIVVRYILLPLLGTALVNGAIRLGLIQPDPLYRFILHLQYAVPPAMNIGTIMQLFGVGESECSVIFLWVYAFASVAVTFWSAFFMWMLFVTHLDDDDERQRRPRNQPLPGNRRPPSAAAAAAASFIYLHIAASHDGQHKISQKSEREGALPFALVRIGRRIVSAAALFRIRSIA
ncbi:hypothetical protein U9M48_014770 [Paspalum notatum var. saurae]|uniref:Uncharacterized protein n=1 Tax=Paspalum notatum var. saurae TaxID=547442 RepID=A0AAQ3T2M3_PASNO